MFVSVALRLIDLVLVLSHVYEWLTRPEILVLSHVHQLLTRLEVEYWTARPVLK
jgi:hypothetical protein